MMNLSLEKYFGILSSSSSSSSSATNANAVAAAASSSKKIDNLETIFNKVFSPISKQADPNLIAQLVASVNQNKENASLAVELVLNKLKSIQEWEVLISLQVLEALVRGCGEPIHELIARYRFLNEIIKIISPKFYGKTSSEKVKTKCIELIFSWSKGLEHRPKIKIAYEMLKMQGLVKQDPIVDELVINVVPRSHTPVFDEEEKLANLLKSKNPKDLELANQLIKEMVKKDEIKIDKSMSRASELEQINNNIKLLNEMLTKYDQKTSNLSEKETIRFLYDELEKMRPKIIQIASEIEENDDSIGTVIKSSDECESVLNKFKNIFKNELTSGEDNHHADDELVDISSDLAEKVKPTSPQALSSSSKSSIKELEDLFIFDSTFSSSTLQPINTQANILNDNIQDLLKPEILHKPNILPNKASNATGSAKSFNQTAFDDLNVLGQALVEHSLKPESNQNSHSMKLNELIAKSQEHKQIN